MEDVFREFAAGAWRVGLSLVGGVVIFAVFWIGAGFVQRLFRRVAERTDAARQDAIALLGQAARVALIVFGALTALGTVGVNVMALVAGLGLTGFALGFAFRDILSNLLAGLLILIHHPFHRHDHIAVTGFEGVVTSVDLRYTTLEGEQGKVLIPNSILFTNPISLRR
jgi:small-conductance mechanosensitive channel